MHNESKNAKLEEARQSDNTFRDWDCVLKLSHINEEFLVRACHQRALHTLLSFVHTARRFYRLDHSIRTQDLIIRFGFDCCKICSNLVI